MWGLLEWIWMNLSESSESGKTSVHSEGDTSKSIENGWNYMWSARKKGVVVENPTRKMLLRKSYSKSYSSTPPKPERPAQAAQAGYAPLEGSQPIPGPEYPSGRTLNPSRLSRIGVGWSRIFSNSVGFSTTTQKRRQPKQKSHIVSAFISGFSLQREVTHTQTVFLFVCGY